MTFRRVEIHPPGTPVEADSEFAYRAAACALAWWAVGGSAGARCGDIEHETVTEGRKRTAGVFYSTCGDLPHFILERLGLTARFVNRAARAGGYVIGRNITALTLQRSAHVDNDEAQAGDVLHFVDPATPNSDHVAVLLGRDDSSLILAEYGQALGSRFVVGMVDGHARSRAPTGGRKRWVGTWSLARLLAAGPLSGAVDVPEAVPARDALARLGEAGSDADGWIEAGAELRGVVEQ